MKVLFDYGAFVMQAYGGVSRVFHELYLEARATPGIDCRFPPGFHQSRHLLTTAARGGGRNPGVYLPRPYGRNSLYHGANFALYAVHSRLFRPDICHFTFFEDLPAPSGAKVVATVHDLITDRYPEMFGAEETQSAKRARVLERCDGVICVSNHTRDDLLERHPELDPDRVHVAHNGNRMAEIAPTPFQHPRPFLLYVGARHPPYKNFDLMLRTLATEELAAFDLVCFGGESVADFETRRWEDLGVARRVSHRAGDDAKLAGMYREAFALVYPSLYEGFGLPPVEAMSCGCPVVASHAPPMPEVIGTQGLFFDPHDLDGCVGQIRRLSVTQERQALIEYGLERSREFTWSKTAESVFAFYERLLS